MSTTIDQRVVEMRFDNQQFEAATATSMSTIEKLKKSLNFSGASKGLEDVSSAAKKVNMAGLGSAVESVQLKFSALQVSAVTALANITNSAVNAGKRITSALTIDPIKMGFQEYETQINSIQTILANTQSKGSTLKDVTAALDELNTYADQTIYNFTEMTRNIGTFTAAGVDLDKSVTSIKGIANLAAISGSSAQQASTAMYQLSQALAAGRVSLMDWNSVVNAGMGGEVFQNALKRTATQMGQNVDALIEKYGSFRESLTEGQWLTADVLTETLTQLSGAYTEADLLSQGYSEAQAKEIVQLAKTAVSAATDVKTFTQLIDTSKEALQSGWTQTWEILIGDFEEAKTLLSDISNVINTAVSESAEARNSMLQDWKDLGGRTALLESLKNVFEGLTSVAKPISEAFRDIFPPITAQRLLEITEGFRDFTEKLKISDETSAKLKDTFKGLFSILDIGKQAVSAVFGGLFDFVTGNPLSSFADGVLSVSASFGRFFTILNEGIKESNVFSSVGDGISFILSGIADAATSAMSIIGDFGEGLANFGGGIVDAFSAVKDKVSGVFDWIKENISAGDIFAGLAGGGIYVAAKNFSDLIENIKDTIGKLFSSIKEGVKFSKVLSSIHDSLESFQQGIKVASLVGIAAAVAILVSSMRSIAELDAGEITGSLVTIRLMIASLNSGFTSMSKTLDKFKPQNAIKAGIAMMAIAKAVDILASAMQKLSDLSLGEIAKGLIGIGTSVVILSKGLQAIGNNTTSLRTSVALLAIAQACKMLSEALSGFSALSWDEIGRGLTAMGGALAELTLVLRNVGGGKSLLGATALLIAVQSLDEIAEVLESLGALSWDEIGRGLAAMGGALLEVGTVTGLLGKLAGFSGILGAGAILLAVQSLDEIAFAMQRLGALSWDEIGRGLAAMGGALLEVSAISGALGALTGLSGLLGSGAILLAVQSLDEIATALNELSSLTWDEIGRGLASMGGALLEVGVVSGALGALTGVAGLLGAGTILLAVQSLGDIATTLDQISQLSWDEIGRGLVGMGGALTEVAVISGLAGSLTGLAGLVGAGTIALATTGLNDLATAFQKFGSMNWDEIGRGLAAMGLAMGETALGGLLNTFSGFGAGAIAAMAEPLGVLADSMKKWAGVSIPENLGSQLASLSLGVSSFNFAGWGAENLSPTATGISLMAEAIRKWSGISIPEALGSQLTGLASGVKAFNFAGWGATALSDAAPGLGDMAGAVQKWTGVTIPGDLGESLSSLASGISAFSFAFVGGWSISSLIEPLSSLAVTMSKWSTVTIADDIDSSLKRLADGIGSFNFSFIGGWSIDSIVGPLSNLADSLKKWNGLNLSGVGLGLNSLSDGLKRLSDISVNSLVTEFENASNGLATAISSMLNGATEVVRTKGSEIVNSIDSLMNEFNSAVKNKSNQVRSTFEDILNSSVATIRSQYAAFSSAGSYIVDGLVNGIRLKKSAAIAEAQSLAQAVETAARVVLDINSPSGAFFDIGTFTVEGLVNGIRKNTPNAENTSASLGVAIVDSFRKVLKINSPSLVMNEQGRYIVQGIAEGITSDMSAEEAAAAKAQSIASAFQTAFDQISFDLQTKDLSYQLWEKMNPNASQAERNAAELDFTIEKLESAKQTLMLARDEYDQTLAELGSNAKETKEAYQKYLQSQIDVATIVEEYNSLLEESMASNQEAMSKYGETYNAIKDRLLQEGYSEEEIRKMAETTSNFDPNLAAKYSSLDVQQVINDTIGTVGRTMQIATEETLKPALQATGTSAGVAISSGLNEAAPEIKSSTKNTVEQCASAIDESKPSWSNGALGLVTAFAETIDSSKGLAINSVDKLMQEIMLHMTEVISSNRMLAMLFGGGMSITGGGASLDISGLAGPKVDTSEVDSMGGAIINALSDVQDEVNDNPITIKPVLDMSSTSTKIPTLQSTFLGTLGSTINSIINRTGSEKQKSSSDSASNVTYNNFTQNNYSPKALSSADIYRQTKNQISFAKGALNKS